MTISKVLLVSANRERFPEPAFPLGAAYVASELVRKNVRPLIFDAALHSRPFKALARAIREFGPDLVGLSLRNVDNVSYPACNFYVPMHKEFVNAIRAATTAPIVLGGSAFTIFPEELLESLGAEAGVTGDGEAGVAAALGGAKGLIQGALPSLEEVSFPNRIEEVFPEFRRYRTIGVQTARGCPHRCIYCTYPALEGAIVRRRAPESVAEDVEGLVRKYGKRSLFIVDSSFNADERHMASVLEALLRRDLGIRFSCYLEPKMGDPALFGLLKRAGCVAVDFGTDSGAPAILRSMRKGFTADDIARSSEACREAGIDMCHSLVFGGPGECEETVAETVRLMDDVRPKAVVAEIGMRVYPGTEAARLAAAEGTISEEQSLLEPAFYFGGADPIWLLAAVRSKAAGRRNWFFPGERDWGKALFFKVLAFFYRGGPLWRAMPGPKNKRMKGG